MEIYKDKKFVTGITYPYITEKIVIKDTTATAKKIVLGWKFSLNWTTKKVTLISPPDPTPEEIEKKDMKATISAMTPELKKTLSYIINKI